MAAASPSRWIDLAPFSGPAPGHILFLSPDNQLAKQMGPQLQTLNFQHRTTSSAETALAAVQTDATIDIVIVDAARNAEKFLAWIKRFTQFQSSVGDFTEPPILLLVVDQEQVPEALHLIESGAAYSFLARPLLEIQFLPEIRKAMEFRRLKQHNSRFRYHLESLISARTQMLQNAMQQLEQSYDITLEALGNALDLKDAETEGHCKRVTAYTLALGRALGLNEQQLRTVGRGAFLHDVGKMAIPDAILRKPGKLTEEEQEIMRTHSELGYRMIQKIPYLREPAEIIYAHQECFDGSGYPRGLRGEEIPVGARIFALADTLDAITSNRPYRKAATIAEARKEVLRCAGTQFDPAIVDVFVATPDSIWLNLREGIMRDGPEFSPFGYTFGEVK